MIGFFHKPGFSAQQLSNEFLDFVYYMRNTLTAEFSMIIKKRLGIEHSAAFAVDFLGIMRGKKFYPFDTSTFEGTDWGYKHPFKEDFISCTKTRPNYAMKLYLNTSLIMMLIKASSLAYNACLYAECLALSEVAQNAINIIYNFKEDYPKDSLELLLYLSRLWAGYACYSFYRSKHLSDACRCRDDYNKIIVALRQEVIVSAADSGKSLFSLI